MSATEMIYKIIDEKCLKQSAVARAAGYDPKKFNALLRGRKKMTSEDVVPICKALGITPNELFGIDRRPAEERVREEEKMDARNVAGCSKGHEAGGRAGA